MVDNLVGIVDLEDIEEGTNLVGIVLEVVLDLVHNQQVGIQRVDNQREDNLQEDIQVVGISLVVGIIGNLVKEHKLVIEGILVVDIHILGHLLVHRLGLDKQVGRLVVARDMLVVMDRLVVA